MRLWRGSHGWQGWWGCVLIVLLLLLFVYFLPNMAAKHPWSTRPRSSWNYRDQAYCVRRVISGGMRREEAKGRGTGQEPKVIGMGLISHQQWGQGGKTDTVLDWWEVSSREEIHSGHWVKKHKEIDLVTPSHFWYSSSIHIARQREKKMSLFFSSIDGKCCISTSSWISGMQH